MESFDQSVKYLLQREPADFIRFGLADPSVRVLGAVPSVLPVRPARGRDVDSAYVVARVGPQIADADIPDDDRRLIHIELHRRHQSLEELALDVAEAQVRLYRREGKLVESHVWDLYGDPGAPVLQKRTLAYSASGSCVAYVRVNLRGLGWDELLARGPPALWSLIALTRDGATEPVIARVRDAINARATWTLAERADHLAVLWFVGEAEGVPSKLMQAVFSEERLMESELYKRIFGEGEVRGKAEDVLAVLAARGIAVSATLRERILRCTEVATLNVWIRRAAVASTAAAVVRAKAPAGAGAARPSHKT
jgi:hypothetical protein